MTTVAGSEQEDILNSWGACCVIRYEVGNEALAFFDSYPCMSTKDKPLMAYYGRLYYPEKCHPIYSSIGVGEKQMCAVRMSCKSFS